MAGQFRQKTFASVSLTRGDEDKFQEWRDSGNYNAVMAMQDFTGRGYKVSITWVVDSNAFCVSVIGTDDCSHNKDTILTSWSDDLEEAVMIAAYKHFEMCGDGSWPTNANGQRWG